MYYDYTIVGCGPSGIAMSLILAHNNENVCILESEASIGGCWKAEWVDDLYYAEHSPKVMFTYPYFEQLLTLLNIDPSKEFHPVYGTYLQTVMKFGHFMFGGLNCYEIYCLLVGIIRTKLGIFDRTKTLHEWLIHNKFSEKGYETFKILSIAAADVPEKLLAYVLFEGIGMDAFNIRQLKQPSKWLDKYTAYIQTFKNVHLFLNHDVSQFTSTSSKITNIVAFDKTFGQKVTFASKEYLVCVPLTNLLNIVKKSNSHVQNNWMHYADFEHYCNMSSYTGFGFQLHFTYQPNIQTVSNLWCWSCTGDWNIIVAQTNDYHSNFSKDPSIQCVWSCTIIDLNAFNTHLQKTVHECTFNEIVTESIRILENLCNCELNPKRATRYNGIERKNNKWLIKDSSCVNAMGTLNTTGKLTNLHYINTINTGKITNLEVALECAIAFADKRNLNNVFRKHKTCRYFYVILCVAILMMVYKFFKFDKN